MVMVVFDGAAGYSPVHSNPRPTRSQFSAVQAQQSRLQQHSGTACTRVHQWKRIPNAAVICHLPAIGTGSGENDASNQRTA